MPIGRARLIASLSLLLALPALAAPSIAAERLGIVLMHGKGSSPARLESLAAALAGAGHLVERPEMCWSRRRLYDRSYLDCLGDADVAVAKLRAAGAAAVVVAGMSLGGNAAVAFGARREGLKGVIALAPAPPFEFIGRQPVIAKSLREAQAMIAAGRGGQSSLFNDLSFGRTFEVEATPAIYVSFYGDSSPGILPENAARLKAPLLIVSGISDPSQRSVSYGFARAPPHRLNWHVTVPGDHLGTPAAARDIVLAWLALLAAR
jgi:pimeloyl-ACP methyl ester carboxylesterase